MVGFNLGDRAPPSPQPKRSEGAEQTRLTANPREVDNKKDPLVRHA